MPNCLHCSHQLFEGLPLHRGDVAVVVEKNLIAAKLTNDDPPATAEDL